MNNDKRGDHL